MAVKHLANVGSISSGTMRNEDLIPDFLWELEHLAKRNHNKLHLTLVEEIQNRIDTIEDYFDTEEASYDLNDDLFEALNEYAKPFCYFGSHPGDGAEFGFWIDDLSIEDGISSGEILTQSDRHGSRNDDIPSKFNGYLLYTNDHGNQTLFKCWPFGNRKEIWAIV
jgi:hypothetical protein